MGIARAYIPWIVLGSLLGLTPARAQGIQSRERDPNPVASESAKPISNPTVQLQLLEGVRLFRTAQYDEALRVFQKIDAERQSADIGFYLGMVLHKLGRHLPALIAFRSAQRSGLHEPVADYYLSVSCFRLGMTTRARSGFTALVAASPSAGSPALPLGPRLQQGARSFLAALPPALADAETETNAALAAHYEPALRSSERLLAIEEIDGALEWFEEAARSLLESPEHPARALRLSEVRELWTRLRSKLGTRSSGDVQAIERLLAN